MGLPPFATFSGEDMGLMWAGFKWILFAISPFIMIYVAFEAVKKLVHVIKGTVEDEEPRRRYYDDDDDY